MRTLLCSRRRHRWWAHGIAASVLVLVALVGPPTERAAWAGVAAEVSLQWLAQRATTIVVGTPEQAYAEWEHPEGSGPNRIWTYSKIKVDQNVAGEVVGTEVWVRVMGGRVGNIGQIVDGEASLPLGKRMLVFLTHRPDGTNGVTGMAQGVYILSRNDDGAERLGALTRRVLLLPRPEVRVPAWRELSGRTLHDAVQLIAAARANHGN